MESKVVTVDQVEAGEPLLESPLNPTCDNVTSGDVTSNNILGIQKSSPSRIGRKSITGEFIRFYSF